MNNDVIVAGAGLAGLSCAFELAEAGHRPLLLEAAPQPGGRTSSWTDPDGMKVESGLLLRARRSRGITQAAGARRHRLGRRRDLGVLLDAPGHNDYLGPGAKLSPARS